MRNNGVFSTDWINSRPVFYNEATGTASHSIHDVIDPADFDFDPDGLRAFLDCGYAAFTVTPVRHVRFLPPNAVWDAQARCVKASPDPAVKWLDKESREDALLAYIQRAIRRWEKSVDGPIVIPTSGGYDSRLLNAMIEEKERIRAFTYGISTLQEQSFESVRAQEVCKRLGVRWERIDLGLYHRYLDRWDAVFGPSAHAHGMYHMEFYDRIRERLGTGAPFLSGIIGDGFSGKVRVPPITDVESVKRLFLTYGLNADSSQCLLPATRDLFDEYYRSRRDLLASESYRIVELLRNKMMLLRYLMVTPVLFGFAPWSPFLDINVGMGMLRLPDNRRQDRLWQKEYFARRNLDVESAGLAEDKDNTLNLQAILLSPPDPLDPELLREIINPDYVRWANMGMLRHAKNLPGVTRQGVLKAYFAYLTMRPLEKLIRRRDAALRGAS